MMQFHIVGKIEVNGKKHELDKSIEKPDGYTKFFDEILNDFKEKLCEEKLCEEKSEVSHLCSNINEKEHEKEVSSMTDDEYIEYMRNKFDMNKYSEKFKQLKDVMRKQIVITKSGEELADFAKLVDIERKHNDITSEEKQFIIDLYAKYDL